MRYSVVLPRAEPGDADETIQALKVATELWSRGDQREALRAIRRAAWACSKAGNDVRALALSKAAKAIQGQLDAAADDASEPPDQPQTRRDTPSARQKVEAPAPAPPSQGRSEPRQSKRPRQSRRPQSRQPSSNNRSKRPPSPETRPATPRAEASAVTPRSGPQASQKLAPSLDLAAADVDLDLVVTVAPGAWQDTEAATLVGHRAARVAVAAVAGKKGTFLVRVLGPGEVAPANAAIALLVALEAGTRKVSKTG